MYYHYDKETKEFLFENIEKSEDFPSTEIDINFNLASQLNQIFDGQKWKIVYDYRKKIVYKKNSLQRIYKTLGQKIEDDEVIYENEKDVKVTYDQDEIKKTNLKFNINGFLSSTDKYFIGHPPKYSGDIEKLKKYREYLYQFTKSHDWWKKELIDFNEWN